MSRPSPSGRPTSTIAATTWVVAFTTTAIAAAFDEAHSGEKYVSVARTSVVERAGSSSTMRIFSRASTSFGSVAHVRGLRYSPQEGERRSERREDDRAIEQQQG